MNIIGQNHVSRYLSEGLRCNKLSPSLLFTGPDGVGKKTVSLELAKALACEDQKGPWDRCDHCSPCKKIIKQIHPDIFTVNADFQATLIKGKPESQRTVKIESIRQINKFLTFKPLEMNRRIVLIEKAHTMTMEAANALLKILEEPNSTSLIILLAEDERNLPSTILSRCALLRFHPIPALDIAKWLVDQESLPSSQADMIAQQSGGSLSRAHSLIDQKQAEIHLSDHSLDEFFDSVTQPSFRRESRKKGEDVIQQLTRQAQQKLNSGDMSQVKRLQHLLQAKKYIDRYVSPRLVLENLFLKLQNDNIF